MCVLLREVGPFSCCATPYSAPGVEPEEFKLLTGKGRLSGSGVMFLISVSGVLVLLEHRTSVSPVLHPPACFRLCSLSSLFLLEAMVIFLFEWIGLSYNVFSDADDDFIFWM